MTIGVGFIGREVDFTIAGNTIAGYVSKSLSINNAPLDTSSDTSNGWAEMLGRPGRKDVTISISTKVQDVDLVMTALNDDVQIFPAVMTFPSGGATNPRIEGDVFLTSVSVSGEHEGLTTMDFELAFSGPVTGIPAGV